MALKDFAGFGFNGYRSFGSAELQRIGPMSRVHLVVGRNNVGKSNVLHYAHDVLSQMRSGNAIAINALFRGALDTPENWSGDDKGVSIALRLSPEIITDFQLDGAAAALIPVFETKAFSKGDIGVVWFDFEITQAGGSNVRLTPSITQLEEGIRQAGHAWQGNLSNISNSIAQTSGDDIHNWSSIIARWQPQRFIPSTHWVDAIREIKRGTSGNGMGRVNGSGLIDDLARLQDPDYARHRADTAKFEALQAFVRSVLDDPTARVQIPNSKTTILVHTHDGTVRPLEGLGTGIAEVVLLAAVATGATGQLICIEEPEIHLHPTLQRKLIEYLYSQTENLYLISTHSAQMLNADLATISHLTLEGECTQIDPVVTPSQLAGAVFDLGNRASDLMQSNFIIWVEGPSDRQYIAHWLKTYDPELIEGAHFSIMFYGGALLNHLSADDQETEELIQLLKINRNFAIVIDSDKSNATSTLNDTKLRVVEEMSIIGAQAWVTDGYTIENYIPRATIEKAIKDEYPLRNYALPSGSYNSPLGKKFTGMESRPSKVMIARRVISEELSWSEWPDELRPHIEELASRIRTANGI